LIPPPRPRRLTQLYAGLVLYGFSDALMLLAGLGVDPWDVLHQGLSRRLGLGVWHLAIIVGAVVLALWIPLRQRPVSARSATSSWSAPSSTSAWRQFRSARAHASNHLLLSGVGLNGSRQARTSERVSVPGRVTG